MKQPFTVVVTDNISTRETLLTCSEIGSQVEVDPVDLFLNMVENCYPDKFEEVEKYVTDLVK